MLKRKTHNKSHAPSRGNQARKSLGKIRTNDQTGELIKPELGLKLSAPAFCVWHIGTEKLPYFC